MTKFMLRAKLAAAATCLLALGLPAGHAAPAAFDLVTPAEARREAQAALGSAPTTRQLRRRDATLPPPEIQVLAPMADGSALAAPVRIELSFKPAPGARVVPSTVRALYGVLKIDLTERLSRNATITERGVVVEKAQMPDGQHRFVMQVSDDRGTVGEQELRIRVGNAP